MFSARGNNIKMWFSVLTIFFVWWISWAELSSSKVRHSAWLMPESWSSKDAVLSHWHGGRLRSWPFEVLEIWRYCHVVLSSWLSLLGCQAWRSLAADFRYFWFSKELSFWVQGAACTTILLHTNSTNWAIAGAFSKKPRPYQEGNQEMS